MMRKSVAMIVMIMMIGGLVGRIRVDGRSLMTLVRMSRYVFVSNDGIGGFKAVGPSMAMMARGFPPVIMLFVFVALVVVFVPVVLGAVRAVASRTPVSPVVSVFT